MRRIATLNRLSFLHSFLHRWLFKFQIYYYAHPTFPSGEKFHGRSSPSRGETTGDLPQVEHRCGLRIQCPCWKILHMSQTDTGQGVCLAHRASPMGWGSLCTFLPAAAQAEHPKRANKVHIKAFTIQLSKDEHCKFCLHM